MANATTGRVKVQGITKSGMKNKRKRKTRLIREKAKQESDARKRLQAEKYDPTSDFESRR